jgi:hypothetical protein
MRDIVPSAPSFGQPQTPDEGLRVVSRCPVCHHSYNPMEAKILDESDGAHLVHVRCKRCHSAIVALILMNNFGISSVGLVTDLDGNEVKKFKDLPEISTNDVLAMHEFLKSSKIEEGLLKD